MEQPTPVINPISEPDIVHAPDKAPAKANPDQPLTGIAPDLPPPIASVKSDL
jgi:hypothetical protein